MKTVTATKEVNGVERSASIEYDFGTPETSGDMFTKEVVHSNFEAKATITAQAAMRRMLEKGKSEEEIKSYFWTCEEFRKFWEKDLDMTEAMLDQLISDILYATAQSVG